MTQAYITNLQSSALSNQNISSALLLATFTNTTRARVLLITAFADQLAGNGSYVVYATRQRAGAGSAYEVGARTTVAVPSGITAQAFPTIQLSVGATDVVKVYLVGLAGDTTTPDTIVDFDEIYVGVGADGNALISTDTQDLSASLSVNTKKINGTTQTAADLSAVVETGVTPNQAMKLILAALAGKVSGAGTTTITFRNASADTKDRIIATVDADGNRSAITLDVT